MKLKSIQLSEYYKYKNISTTKNLGDVWKEAYINSEEYKEINRRTMKCIKIGSTIVVGVLITMIFFNGTSAFATTLDADNIKMLQESNPLLYKKILDIKYMYSNYCVGNTYSEQYDFLYSIADQVFTNAEFSEVIDLLKGDVTAKNIVETLKSVI